MKNFVFILILFATTLSACAPTEPLPTPTATPIHQITFSPSLETFRPQFQSCADSISNGFFQFQIDQDFLLETADLIIRLGEPETLPGFTAQIGQEKIVAILHPSNSITHTQNDLQYIFSGRISNWAILGEEGDIKVWTLPLENETSQIFQENFLEGMLFSSNAQIAPGPAQMLEAVSNDPNAIGFLPQSWVNSGVLALDLNLEVPLLILAESEPEAAIREFVACMQKP